MSRPSFKEEKTLWKKGYNYIIGVDEVGKGAFSGPVVVGAVVFNKDHPCTRMILEEINDSKLLSAKTREKLSPLIKKQAIKTTIARTSVEVINKIGISNATKKAFRKAISRIIKKIQKIEKNPKFFVLADGYHIKHVKEIGLKKQKAIIKGDRKCVSIAAASIIAKVYRDKLMQNIHKNYPLYNFSKNKGYGTKEHREMIKKYGLCDIHRKSFNLQKFLCTLLI